MTALLAETTLLIKRGRSISLLFAAFLAVGTSSILGCASNQENSVVLNSASVGERRDGDRAVVLGSVERTLRTFGIPSRGQVSFQIRSWGHGRFEKFFFLEDGFDNAAIPTGQYALMRFHIPSSVTSYEIGGWRRREDDVIGRFDVSKGEVIYIGHLVFRPNGDTLSMQVEDRFEEYKLRLPPTLAGKVEKRLIALPESVSFSQRRTRRISN